MALNVVALRPCGAQVLRDGQTCPVSGGSVIGNRARSWIPIAAYLYVLTLDGASLAWEYLRRNADYRQDCTHTQTDPAYFTKRWGLTFPENPELDARSARPGWHIPSSSSPPRHSRSDTENAAEDGTPFSLWTIPGRKSLHQQDSRHLDLTAAATRSYVANVDCRQC